MEVEVFHKSTNRKSTPCFFFSFSCRICDWLFKFIIFFVDGVGLMVSTHMITHRKEAIKYLHVVIYGLIVTSKLLLFFKIKVIWLDIQCIFAYYRISRRKFWMWRLLTCFSWSTPLKWPDSCGGIVIYFKSNRSCKRKFMLISPLVGCNPLFVLSFL